MIAPKRCLASFRQVTASFDGSRPVRRLCHHRSDGLVLQVAVPDSGSSPNVNHVITALLTEGDLDRGRAPDRKSAQWRCGTVDPATGAVCTRRPHRSDEQHQGHHAVQGTGRSTRVATWIGGSERAMVVDGYTWTRIPGTVTEVRALTATPLALRYRPSGHRSR